MKKIIIFVLMMGILIGCSEEEAVNYRESMRTFVIEISQYAESVDTDFIVMAQNGLSLVIEDDQVQQNYLEAVDGFSQESIFVGYAGDNQRTAKEESDDLLTYIKIIKAYDKAIMAIHYTDVEEHIEYAHTLSKDYGLISVYAERTLSKFPSDTQKAQSLWSEGDINLLSDVQSVLYLINPEAHDHEVFIDLISETSYDLIVVDAYDNHQNLLSTIDITQLKEKPNGESRLVIAYMSIGEAEDYRAYFKEEWQQTPPSWLDKENPHWAGNFKVKYWQSSWQKVIFGEKNSYLDQILRAGFDGVYLDIIDAYEYYE